MKGMTLHALLFGALTLRFKVKMSNSKTKTVLIESHKRKHKIKLNGELLQPVASHKLYNCLGNMIEEN